MGRHAFQDLMRVVTFTLVAILILMILAGSPQGGLSFIDIGSISTNPTIGTMLS